MSFELILPFLRPIEPLLLDESVSEIMGNPDSTWWFERDGILRNDASIQFDPARLRTGLEVVANKLGKKLDEDNPMLNAQLPDGSRLAAVIPPVVRPAPAMVIRKFTYDPRRLTGVSVYREIDREFSVGDRIQFTAPDKTLGVANRDLAVIDSIAPDGRISARLDNSRQVEFNAHDHRHFDHGYAVTSHSSQGLTAERVLVNADTGVHPDLLNCRFGYVSISRASHEATVFTDDMTKLSPQLSADVSKTSALEINQAPSIGQGIGMM